MGSQARRINGLERSGMQCIMFDVFIIIDDRIRPFPFLDLFKFPRDGATGKEDFMSN